MKEFTMLIGFGIGLVVGAYLYKNSQGTRELVKKAEKGLIDGMEKLADQKPKKQTSQKNKG